MSFSPSEDSIVKLYLSLGDAERQLGKIQNRYRLLASTWTLASLAAIGFILTRTLPDGLEERLICCLIALSGAVSILILWLVDIRVYQQLLSQYFNEGMAMESGEPWLPQVRNQTRLAFDGSLALYISVYYVLLFTFLLGVACLFMGLSPTLKPGSSCWIAIALGVGFALIGLILTSVWPRKIVAPKRVLPLATRISHYQQSAGARALPSRKPQDPAPSG